MNTPTSSAPNAHGGARPGAGRTPKVVKYEHPIQDATERCANRLSQTLDELEQLAQGVPVTHERWVAAGTLTIGRGKDARPAFPDLPPEQLVLVARTTTSAKPDARAVLYLADRVLGRLTTSDQTFLEEQLGAELQLFIEKIKARFTPEMANALFRTLTLPDTPPPIPRNQDDLQALAEQIVQEQIAQQDQPTPEETSPEDQPTPTRHSSKPDSSKPSIPATTAHTTKHTSRPTIPPLPRTSTPPKASRPHKPPKEPPTSPTSPIRAGGFR